MGPQHKRVYARLRRAMRGDDPSRICWVRFAKMRGDRACTSSHDVKQPLSFPRRISALGVCNFASPTPSRGVGGAPRDVRVLGGTPLRPAHDAAGQALARRLASHNAGRSPLGAPPWRFWAPGAALLSPAFAPDRLQRAPRTQVVVPGGRGPEPPEANGYEPPPQDATPRSAFGIVSRRRPSMSKAGTLSSTATLRSQTS